MSTALQSMRLFDSYSKLLNIYIMQQEIPAKSTSGI